MTPATEIAYRNWLRLADRGYGEKTHISNLRRVDERIRAAKAKFERLLAAEKAQR